MLQLEKAENLLCEQVNPMKETETIPLLKAIGRMIAQDGKALEDQPPFPRAPLDGYAVRGIDTTGAEKENSKTFTVIGKVCAGSVFKGEVKEREAVRIMTGAPIPKGADTVIRQEDTDYGEEEVKIFSSSKAYENYCPQGEDYRAGQTLIKNGSKILGAQAAILASLGIAEVEVYQRAKIAVISTGDEVMQPGKELESGKIYDSNLHYICARLIELGIEPMVSCHCSDDTVQMAEMIKRIAPKADLIITTGGVSVGEKDIMHEVLTFLNAKKLFWQVDIKPGAPTLAADYLNTLIICLSGNPYGAAANFELLVRPVIGKLTGDCAWIVKKKKAVLQNNFFKRSGVRRFLRGWEDSGKVWVVTGNQSSGALASMLNSNCLIEISKNREGARKGDQVWIHPI